jgi:2-methylcitrate dehydratase PrpD
MSMKSIVKTFNGYLNEGLSHEEEGELHSMGFSDRLELTDRDEISDKITEHFGQDPEVQELVTKIEQRLRVLAEEFDQKYSYDSDEMQATAEQMMEYSHGEEPNIYATVEMVAAWGMV